MKDMVLVIALTAAVAASSCAFGMLIAFNSLSHFTYTKVEDGKEELRIRLILGPLSYTIVVQEKNGEVAK